MRESDELKPADLVARVESVIESSVAGSGGNFVPVNPGHRIVFHWPPHAVSHDYHVDAESFVEEHSIEVRGEKLLVKIARTPFGIFGRVEDLWNEARGETINQVLRECSDGVLPWFDRMDAITATLGREERYHGFLDDLAGDDLVALLYCPIRDVAHHAMVEIEKRASTGLFTDALVTILRDQRHPYRRIAQWCVLDMFEDISAFAKSVEEEKVIIAAIHDLIWRSEDDFARTTYKAGVVLGGHISTNEAADALLDCISGPNKVGRRSAMHAVFHLVEWLPQRRNDVVERLRRAAREDSDAQLRDFAAYMADDVESGAAEHVDEPVFPEEMAAAG